MSIVLVEGLTHQNGGKVLYRDSDLRINKGEHVALVGANGTGKTTLFNIIAQKIVPDNGIVELHPKSKIGYLDQHQEVDMSVTGNQYLKEAYQDLFDIQDKINKIYEDMAIEYKEDELVAALAMQEELAIKGFAEIEKNIGNLANGLGIEPVNLTKKLSELSGGQRGKILLAKLLLKNDDFILLDEPTNFLDVEQVEWLAKFLQQYENAFLVISHDKDFINKSVDVIYAIENLQVNRYVGNYDKYIELSELRSLQYDKDRQSQQQEINKLKTYISKNAARASTAKSAQSRQKQLEKIDVMSERKDLTKPRMSFNYKRPNSSVIVRAKDLEIGYTFALTKPLNFELREGEKCIVKGYNGIGKTTFLKTIAKELNPINGNIEIGNGVDIAFFHQVEHYDGETPITYLLRKNPNMIEKDARATIGKFGLKSDLMMNPMSLLSGGEQTKVRLAAISLEPSSLLIFDEPTNHIDVLAKEALLDAIKEFPGTVLLTTHDINFETNWADKILDFED